MEKGNKRAEMIYNVTGQFYLIDTILINFVFKTCVTPNKEIRCWKEFKQDCLGFYVFSTKMSQMRSKNRMFRLHNEMDTDLFFQVQRHMSGRVFSAKIIVIRIQSLPGDLLGFNGYTCARVPIVLLDYSRNNGDMIYFNFTFKLYFG